MAKLCWMQASFGTFSVFLGQREEARIRKKAEPGHPRPGSAGLKLQACCCAPGSIPLLQANSLRDYPTVNELNPHDRMKKWDIDSIHKSVAVQVAGTCWRIEQKVVNEAGHIRFGDQTVGIEVADDHGKLPVRR